ncbi:MAG: ABC transporter ATP-binding protein [Syntrophomonas sp.]
MNGGIFSLNKVTYTFSTGENLFRDLDLEINAGESISLLGANGSGKSSLLKLLCGLIFPSQGSFLAFGKQVAEETFEKDSFSKEYHRRVGFVFQNSDVQLFTNRVWDEIAFGPLQLGYSFNEAQRRVDDVIDLLNIKNLSERSPYRLSGGEKKKVAFASVLVMNPEVLIMDEPTNGLDPKTQRWLTDLLLQLNGSGRTIITATHNLELAHAISRRALVLSEEHQLVCDGDTRDILGNRELLSGVNLIDEYTHVHENHEHTHRFIHS